MKGQLLHWLISPFPPDSIYRRIGKRLCCRLGLSAKQKFYEGIIYFDAVGQSWAFKGAPYETVDTQLKDELLSLSWGCGQYIDIGCNIGQIALSILLRNKAIDAVCVDPNARVLRLLKKSLRANHLEHRALIKNVAVGNEAGVVHFTSEISETGHISRDGYQVKCLPLADLINEYSSQECLVKIDVEGFETILLQKLDQFRNVQNVCLVVELHALGYNEGNPDECMRLLLQSGATLRHLNGLPVSNIDPSQITQVIAQWNP
ncbi:MAG: FkbM family methyltransferase [Limisphaerales bacterium]